MRKNRRAMALILVLLMTSLLFLMVMTLIMLFRGQIFSSQTNLSRVSALYLAEAGVAESMLELENDPAWPGVAGKVVPGIPGGAYTVTFGGAVPDLQSVNNLANAGWGASYHGANTVPPYSALLVVQANVNGTRRILEVVVSKGTAIPSMDNPVLSSGRVLLGGNVSISGVTSLTDNTPVPAGIHSNVYGNVPDAVKWTGGMGDTATVSGRVSTTSGAGASAIDMGSATVTGGTLPGASAVALPNIDILGTIGSKAGSPAPVINGAGVTTLAPGDYYYSGDLNINGGDLKLQSGASLYVTGKLTVNGSITGEGSVYAGSDTRFQGDARLTSLRSNNNVAVFSHGSLYLDGFNGTDYIAGIAAGDPTLNGYWSESQTVLGAMQNRMNTLTQADIVVGGANFSEVDQMRRSLGQSTGPTYAGTQNDLMYKMARHLEATQPASSSRDFLIQKFDDIDHFYEGKNRVDNFTDDGTIMTTVVVRDDWDTKAMAVFGGWFDNMIDNNYGSQYGEMVNFTNNVDYNNIGSSYFQGMVYTNGFVHANNGVTVTGVVVARDDGTQGPAVVNGQNLKPGDLFFDNDCKVTFVQDLYDGSGFVAPSNDLTLTTWMGR